MINAERILKTLDHCQECIMVTLFAGERWSIYTLHAPERWKKRLGASAESQESASVSFVTM